MQIDAIRVPAACAARSASSTSAGASAPDVVAARHHDRVGVGQRIDAVVGADAQPTGVDLRCGGTDPQVS